MKYIVYMSAASRLMNEAQLIGMLEQSRRNNLINNITGMLLYNEGTFIQVLEGEEKQVDEAYERIVNDSRHRNIIRIYEGVATERLFPGWSMCFRNVLSYVPVAVSDYVNPIDEMDWSHAPEHPAIFILKAFSENNAY